MMTDAVVDSSFLVSLARIGRLDLLLAGGSGLMTVREVHEETVLDGRTRGYADADAIARIFDQGTIRFLEPRGKATTTDKKLLLLARELRAELWVDDIGLARKARRQKVGVRSSVDLIASLVDRGGLNRADALDLFERLHAQNRISQEVRDRARERVFQGGAR